MKWKCYILVSFNEYSMNLAVVTRQRCDEMTTYRKRTDKDTWHWCKNCTNYPTEDYREITVSNRPSYGELCNECRAKEKLQNRCMHANPCKS